MASKIKVNSEVVVITGKSKGTRAKVLGVNDDRVIVEGVALVKKHMKPSQDNQTGGIVTREGSIHISNVMLADRYDSKRIKKGTSVTKKATKTSKAKK